MMNRKYLVLCFVSLSLVPAAGASISNASESVSASSTAASSAGKSDAEGNSLPAGVSAEWWAQTKAAIRQFQQPNADAAAPLRPRASWKAEGNQAGASFGYSVRTAGDVNGDGYDDVIVGASHYDNGQRDEGRAFVYYGSASGLSLTPDWTAESNEADAWFGFSVGTAGDVNADGYDDVVIGAVGHYYFSGRAFVYYGSAAGLSPTPGWVADGQGGEFGISVGSAGDVNGDGYDDVIVGADNDGTGKGQAFVYPGSPSGLSLIPDWTVAGDQEGAFFGFSVSTARDINHDGYDDVIVGAYGQDGKGAAFAYYGSGQGLSITPDWTVESDQADALFGISVGNAGDVNGDGYDDVIVGALNDGLALVYYGSASGLSLTPDWTAQGVGFGGSVGTARDMNGDGYDDVVIGTDRYGVGGAAFVYYGSALGLSAAADLKAQSDLFGVHFGLSASTAGDVDSDGYDDLIVGAPVYSHSETSEGGAVVFNGRVGGHGGGRQR